MPVADVQQRRLDALRLDGLAVHERHREGLRIERERAIQIVGCHSDVIDPSEHGTCSLRRRWRLLVLWL